MGRVGRAGLRTGERRRSMKMWSEARKRKRKRKRERNTHRQLAFGKCIEKGEGSHK